MADIILIEDNKEEGQYKVPPLEEAGHTVNWIHEQDTGPCQDSVRTILQHKRYDVLLLDIYLEDKYGGIHVYNNLVSGGYRPRWDHTIIYSRYTGPKVRSAQDGHLEYPIKIFIETAGIPIENIISSLSGGRMVLNDRIKELMNEGPANHCRLCGRNYKTGESALWQNE